MQETKEIHSHQVMEMMLDTERLFTKESLKASILQKFGQDARFCACSASNMDAEGIIAFLESQGKFIDANTGFTTDHSLIFDK
jgi:probable metal-binding protein